MILSNENEPAVSRTFAQKEAVGIEQIKHVYFVNNDAGF